MEKEMEEEEEDVDAMAEESAKQAGPACKNRARIHQLHKSFMHLSKALKKLHARRVGGGGGHQANASGGEGEPPTPSSFLSGCMHHPRTHSFASGRRHHRHAHEDDDDLAVNFRSLRIGGPSAGAAAVARDGGSSSSPQDRYSSSSSDGASEESEGVAPPPPPPQPPAAAPANNKAVLRGAGVAVVTFSAAPYEDFRRSMREMVDAAAVRGGDAGAPAVDWDLMEELLFCYLHLNDRAVHRDILRAFTDTVAALRRRRRAATRRRGARADSSDDGAAVAPSSLYVSRGRGGA